MGFLSEKKKKKINDFVKFVKHELDIETLPKLLIMNGRGDLKTTANYDYTKKDKVIKINSKNRATVDVMRSLAHELTHHKQYEQGRLKVKPPDIGGEIEDEANAKAGQLIKKFAKNCPDIYELDEQESSTESTTPSSEPSSPTTTSTSSTDGYPEVGKWESGVVRGPANQIGNTLWSDVVGSTLTRGKANKLK